MSRWSRTTVRDEAQQPVHPAHVTVSGQQHVTGVDLSRPCGCAWYAACPCRCHGADGSPEWARRARAGALPTKEYR